MKSKIISTIKVISVLVVTFSLLAIPAFIIYIQRGHEEHFVPSEPRYLENPLGTMLGGIGGTEKRLNISQDIGVSFGRIDISWKNVQKNSTYFNFSVYDEHFEPLLAQNVSILGVLNYDHNDIETNSKGREQDKYIAPSDVPKFLNYVNETLAHFYPIISHFEIWNEPNLPLHWMGSWEDYTYLFNQTVKSKVCLCFWYFSYFIGRKWSRIQGFQDSTVCF